MGVLSILRPSTPRFGGNMSPKPAGRDRNTQVLFVELTTDRSVRYAGTSYPERTLRLNCRVLRVRTANSRIEKGEPPV
jgi:hypothetical protein